MGEYISLDHSLQNRLTICCSANRRVWYSVWAEISGVDCIFEGRAGMLRSYLSFTNTYFVWFYMFVASQHAAITTNNINPVDHRLELERWGHLRILHQMTLFNWTPADWVQVSSRGFSARVPHQGGICVGEHQVSDHHIHGPGALYLIHTRSLGLMCCFDASVPLCSICFLMTPQNVLVFHDRSKFEVHVYATTPPDTEDMLQKMRGVDWRKKVSCRLLRNYVYIYIYDFHLNCISVYSSGPKRRRVLPRDAHAAHPAAVRADKARTCRRWFWYFQYCTAVFIMPSYYTLLLRWCCRSHGIHILMNWDGYSNAGIRAGGIFALQPSPIQINHQVSLHGYLCMYICICIYVYACMYACI